MSNRKRNPRRVLLEMLKPTRDRLNVLRDRWAWLGRKTVYGDPNTPKGWRDRRPDEYPENAPDEWLAAYTQVDKAIKELTAVRAFVAEQYHEAKARAQK